MLGPRDEDTVADSLTNKDFRVVDSSKRVDVSWRTLDLNVLNSLWKEREDVSR